MQAKIHYADGLIAKLEHVRATCGGATIHDALSELSVLNMRVALAERCPDAAHEEKLDAAIKSAENFLARYAMIAS
jgi:hypothetical protein